MSSIFDSVELAPRDPTLGINEQFSQETRPNKVNLGVGVYYDDRGRLPLLDAVHQAELNITQEAAARGYLPIEGIPGYNQGAQRVLLGDNSPAIQEGRALTAQTLGGTGALKIGADFLQRLLPNSTVVVSDPTWQNHVGVFENAGFTVGTYPYYDAAANQLDFDAMLAALQKLPQHTIVVLHACCHNPTGMDPTPEQWDQIIKAVKDRQLVPFMDIAYQGFGEGLDKDAAVVRKFVDHDLTLLVSSSFSKSFSFYGERVGALTLITSSQEESERVLSQLKRMIRTNYSTPPIHGAKVVAKVLNTPKLFSLWENELAAMRQRIQKMREALVQALKDHGVTQDFSFILEQRGMFSYSGLTASQVDELREKHAIYAISSGRICIAALNSENIDYVAQAIAEVL